MEEIPKNLVAILATAHIEEFMAWIATNQELDLSLRISYMHWYNRDFGRKFQLEIDNYWIADAKDYYEHHDRPYLR